jgi:hypothetical protein
LLTISTPASNRKITAGTGQKGLDWTAMTAVQRNARGASGR